MIPVIVIFAPTACGKTALAEEIFGKSSLSIFKNRGEIISADSQAVYKCLNIGTAKPSAEEMQELPHHLVDVAEPFDTFGLGEFMEAADSLCREIWSRGKIPVVLGGTGFYIRNFLLGAPKTPESNPEIRAQVKMKLSQVGKEALYEELKLVDPEYAQKISVNDEYRICRALEVFYTSGMPLSSFKTPDELRKEYNFCTIILNRDKEDLYARINSRVDKMFEMGLEREVEHLKSIGCTKDTFSMKAIGYSEFFIDGLSSGEIRERIKNDSRHYAKKQYVFMRLIPGAVTIHADDKAKVLETITNFARNLFPAE